VFRQRKYVEKLGYIHRKSGEAGTGSITGVVALEQLSRLLPRETGTVKIGFSTPIFHSLIRIRSGEECLPLLCLLAIPGTALLNT